jgi:membrane protease subunit (stomatin/prohibitin family)
LDCIKHYHCVSEIKFSKNYSDHSVNSGANAGFQFEFNCERCGDAWRTDFVAFRSGQASSWLGRAAGFFGGRVLSEVESAAQGLAQAGYGKAHDEAFAAAVEQAKLHFHRCARCLEYVCDPCWNGDKGLCRKCAPDAEVEIDAARAEGEVKMARMRAEAAGEKLGETIDVKRERQLSCPKCKAETHGAKFCPECGEKLAVQSQCPKCAAEVSAGSKFCPECGAKM